MREALLLIDLGNLHVAHPNENRYNAARMKIRDGQVKGSCMVKIET